MASALIPENGKLTTSCLYMLGGLLVLCLLLSRISIASLPRRISHVMEFSGKDYVRLAVNLTVMVKICQPWQMIPVNIIWFVSSGWMQGAVYWCIYEQRVTTYFLKLFSKRFSNGSLSS